MGTLWIVGAASAAGLGLEATEDTTIFSENGASSNGSGPVVHAGTNSAGDVRRALLRFDVASIPAGSTITAVTVRLVVDQAGGAAPPLALSLRPASMSWGEAGSATGGGSGAPALPGDATWSHAVLPTDLWTTPGGDAGPVSATTVVAGVGPYTWSDAGLVADVQGWVDGAPNHGWLLAADDELSLQTAKRFPSSEAAIDAPQLDVEFVPGPLLLGAPDPGVAGVANALTVSNAVPGEDVVLVWSGRAGATPVPGCVGVTLGLAVPRVLGTLPADAAGEATFVATVPAAAAGVTVGVQAVQPATCTLGAALPVSF